MAIFRVKISTKKCEKHALNDAHCLTTHSGTSHVFPEHSYRLKLPYFCIFPRSNNYSLPFFRICALWAACFFLEHIFEAVEWRGTRGFWGGNWSATPTQSKGLKVNVSTYFYFSTSQRWKVLKSLPCCDHCFNLIFIIGSLNRVNKKDYFFTNYFFSWGKISVLSWLKGTTE